jgi:hypothetical protein
MHRRANPARLAEVGHHSSALSRVLYVLRY